MDQYQFKKYLRKYKAEIGALKMRLAAVEKERDELRALLEKYKK